MCVQRYLTNRASATSTSREEAPDGQAAGAAHAGMVVLQIPGWMMYVVSMCGAYGARNLLEIMVAAGPLRATAMPMNIR